MEPILLLSVLLSIIFPIQTQELITCGGFENCVNYYDGCNSCFCSIEDANSITKGCTKMFCKNYGSPKCTNCAQNYTLMDGKCDAAASTIPSCGNIDYCVNFTPDGCNSCGCSEDIDGARCTEMYCGPETTNRCTLCTEGYRVKDGHCIPNTCDLPKQVGPCEAIIPRYYYNNETETCELFHYGGCGGNENNFKDEGSCLQFAEQCQATNVTTTTEKPTSCGDVEECNVYSNGCAACVCSNAGDLMCDDVACEDGADVTSELACIGCNDGFTLLYGQCVEQNIQCGGFENCVSYYDGCNTCSCGGWLNACTRMYCEPGSYGEAECKGCGEGYILMEGQCEEDPNAVTDVCGLTPDPGPCDAAFDRYFYSDAMRQCLLFTYGGCEGNENNFETETECIQQCAELNQNSAMSVCIQVGFAMVTSFLV